MLLIIKSCLMSVMIDSPLIIYIIIGVLVYLLLQFSLHKCAGPSAIDVAVTHYAEWPFTHSRKIPGVGEARDLDNVSVGITPSADL